MPELVEYFQDLGVFSIRLVKGLQRNLYGYDNSGFGIKVFVI